MSAYERWLAWRIEHKKFEPITLRMAFEDGLREAEWTEDPVNTERPEWTERSLDHEN